MLKGKRIVVTGVLTDGPIAWHVARLAQEEGASILVTGFGRAMRLTERPAQRLLDPPPILELLPPSHEMNRLVAEIPAELGVSG